MRRLRLLRDLRRVAKAAFSGGTKGSHLIQRERRQAAFSHGMEPANPEARI